MIHLWLRHIIHKERLDLGLRNYSTVPHYVRHTAFPGMAAKPSSLSPHKDVSVWTHSALLIDDSSNLLAHAESGLFALLSQAYILTI